MSKSAFEFQVKDVYPSRDWKFADIKDWWDYCAKWEFAPGRSMMVYWESSNNQWKVDAAGCQGSGKSLREAANEIHERFSEYARWACVIQPRRI